MTEAVDLTLRISALIDHEVRNAGGYKAVSKSSGIPHSTLRLWGNGGSDPSFSKVLHLFHSLYGEDDVSAVRLVSKAMDTAPPADVVTVPVYAVELSAGDGRLVDRAEVVARVPFRLEYLQELVTGGDISGLSMMRVRGDSMSGTLEDGDHAMVDENDKRICDDIFAFTSHGEARIKRFAPTLSGLTIMSDNAELYAPETVRAEELNSIDVIGRVIWRMGQL